MESKNGNIGILLVEYSVSFLPNFLNLISLGTISDWFMWLAFSF